MSDGALSDVKVLDSIGSMRACLSEIVEISRCSIRLRDFCSGHFRQPCDDKPPEYSKEAPSRPAQSSRSIREYDIQPLQTQRPSTTGPSHSSDQY